MIEEFEDPSSRYQNPRYSGKKVPLKSQEAMDHLSRGLGIPVSYGNVKGNPTSVSTRQKRKSHFESGHDGAKG